MKSKVEVNGQTFYVKKPGYKELTDAKMHSAKIFNQARLSGAMIKSQLWDYMRTSNMWSEEKQKELDELNKIITENTNELQKGKNGKFKKLSEAKAAALQIKLARLKERYLLSEYTSLEAMTLEGMTEQANFDYLVFSCTYKEDGTKAFDTLDSYFEVATEYWARKCAEELSVFVYDLDKDWESKLPENIFLKKYNFVNDKFELIDNEGQSITEEPVVFEEFDNDLGT